MIDNSSLPTPRPRPSDRMSTMLILGFTVIPIFERKERNAAVAFSKSSLDSIASGGEIRMTRRCCG